MTTPTFTLVPAAAAHCRLLVGWANDPSSIATKQHTQGPIAYADHERWFAARLADPDCRIWIVMIDETPAGQVRLQRKSEFPEIDVFVDPVWRQHGLGAAIVKSAMNKWWQGVRREPVMAVVMAGNEASHRLFQRAGFARTADNGAFSNYLAHPA